MLMSEKIWNQWTNEAHESRKGKKLEVKPTRVHDYLHSFVLFYLSHNFFTGRNDQGKRGGGGTL